MGKGNHNEHFYFLKGFKCIDSFGLELSQQSYEISTMMNFTVLMRKKSQRDYVNYVRSHR